MWEGVQRWGGSMWRWLDVPVFPSMQMFSRRRKNGSRPVLKKELNEADRNVPETWEMPHLRASDVRTHTSTDPFLAHFPSPGRQIHSRSQSNRDPTRNIFLFQHISGCFLMLILRDCLWSLFLSSRHHRGASSPPWTPRRDRRLATGPGCGSWMGFGNLALHYSFGNERPTERLPEFILIGTDEVTVVFVTFIAIVITPPSAITGDVRILDDLKMFIYSLSRGIRINWFALEINKYC